VIFRKVTNGFRSAWGAEAYADIPSIAATGRLNGRSPLDAIRSALAGQSVLVGISTRMLQELGGSTVFGPRLVGLTHPVQIVSLGAKDSGLVNMAALATYDISGGCSVHAPPRIRAVQ
jgi:hypothetical protein